MGEASPPPICEEARARAGKEGRPGDPGPPPTTGQACPWDQFFIMASALQKNKKKKQQKEEEEGLKSRLGKTAESLGDQTGLLWLSTAVGRRGKRQQVEGQLCPPTRITSVGVSPRPRRRKSAVCERELLGHPRRVPASLLLGRQPVACSRGTRTRWKVELGTRTGKGRAAHWDHFPNKP